MTLRGSAGPAEHGTRSGGMESSRDMHAQTSIKPDLLKLLLDINWVYFCSLNVYSPECEDTDTDTGDGAVLDHHHMIAFV